MKNLWGGKIHLKELLIAGLIKRKKKKVGGQKRLGCKREGVETRQTYSFLEMGVKGGGPGGD